MTPERALAADVRVGCCGWSYADWEGVFYPPGATSRFDRLAWLARFFDCAEIDVTFYRVLPQSAAASWARRTPEGFLFTAKLHRDFTHRRPLAFSEAEAARIRNSLAPLIEAGRFGGLLVQFPWSFKDGPAERDHLARLADAFGRMNPFLEVRHRSWTGHDAMDYAMRRGFCPVNVDQPVIGQSIELARRHDGHRAYFRLHGRNEANWFAQNPKLSDTERRDARYNYLYGGEELDEIVGHVGALLEKVKQVLVLANNHYKAQAAVNALQIVARLRQSRVPVPEMLIEHYPFLKDIADDGQGDEGVQGKLL